jgi:hypothetical protein
MKRWIKQLIRSKTIWFSLVLSVFGVIEANFSLFETAIGAKWYPTLFTIVGVTTAVLRLLTTTSIGEK